ncbi:IFT172, partial [Symbiodinium pilosum]
QMYLAVNEFDLAINMYKKREEYEQMLRLVSKYRKELLNDTYKHIAEQYEMKGNLKKAEHYYVEAKMWTSAMSMYRQLEKWEDAKRVAKMHGGKQSFEKVVLAQAHATFKEHGAEAGAQLLAKHGLIEIAIDYAVEHSNFQHAFELANHSAKHKLPDIHLKKALALEDDEQFKLAEEEFIKANKPKEAIDMYVHGRDWVSAMRVAEAYERESVKDVMVHHAKDLVDQNNMQVCKKHCPQMLGDVVDSYGEGSAAPGRAFVAGSGAPQSLDEILDAAKIYEETGNYSRAIDAYLSVNETASAEPDRLEEVWENAVRLSMKNAPERYNDIVAIVSKRLKLIQRFEAAAELYESIDAFREAVNCYIAGEVWDKARQLAQQHCPDMVRIVEDRYKSDLVGKGDGDELIRRTGDVDSALDMYARNGDWTKCLALAEKHSPKMLPHYLAHLAAQMLVRYGPPPEQSNFQLYKASLQVSRAGDSSGPPLVREMLLRVMTPPGTLGGARFREKGMAPELVAKISVALCRYCAEFPVDIAFYDAGIDCKNAGMINMSFFFLNRFLDIADAIEDPDNAAIDNTDFMETDIPSPYDLDLPEQAHVTNDKVEEIRDCVLGWSMDQSVQQKMDLRQCDKCGAQIYTGSLTCMRCGNVSEPCAQTSDTGRVGIHVQSERVLQELQGFRCDRCSMADSPGPDPQDEGDEVDDGDFPFLKADHPAYKRLQEAWRKQLTGHNDRVTLQLREKQEELKKLVKHREDIGVTLYGAQQQLAKLQLQLEQLHDKYAMVQGKRLEDDEQLKNVTGDWEGKKVEVEEATRRLAKSQDELNQLNITVRQVQEYNEQMKAEIQVTRRATYKAEDHIKQIEEMKTKQDLLIDSMNEDIKRLTERKALLDAQISAQRQETEAAMATLREASREMEAIEFEKKQLLMQWRSSLVGMQRRDEALQNVQKALEEQSEAELAIENEIRGLHSSIRTEQERHEQLCALRDRNEKEMQNLQSQMTSLKQEREKLMDQYTTLNKSMDAHVEETQKLKSAITEQTRSMEVLERNMQTVSREITSIVGKIEEEQSEQTTCERVTANSHKRMKKIREEIAAKEVETQNLLNEIARVTVDSLNTKAHNQMLKDRHKQLSDELADREKLIEQYEQEIRKRHHQIEKKQLFVDRLNREYDEKRTKLEAELGNDEDVAGPQEAKLKHMRKAIAELTKECSEMQKDWIQKQTQLLSISSETDKLKATLNENKNKKMVLEQKKLRIEGQLSSHEKEIKELENNMKHLRFDMDRMNSALVKNEARSSDISNTNQMMETEFVQKLKEIETRCLDMERDVEKLKMEKDQMNQDILESERQVLLWERKITLEREMQAALDPNVGQSDAAAMKKEIHRMELRLEQLKRRQEQTIVEMERAIHKRDAIALKLEPKAQKTKKAASAANVKRQLQSLRNNLKLCTQANSDAEQKISERQRDLAELQQTIEQAAQEYGNLERAGEALRAEVQVGHVEKQQNLASILQFQRTAKRLDELAMGTGPPPPANIQQQHDEQV